MKEVNRAYRDGDVARLLEIERAWKAAAITAASLDEAERRCAALERTNGELRAQLNRVTREEKSLRASEIGRLVIERNRRGAPDPLRSIVKQGKEEIERLTQLRSWLRQFRDGEISLDELLAGPAMDDERDLELEMFIGAAMVGEMARPRRRGRRRRR
jgi:hypothetical protein